MNTANSNRVIAGVTTVMFFSALTWGVWQTRNNHHLEKDLVDKIKLSESRLSDIAILERDMRRADEQISSLDAKNSDLKKTIAKVSDESGAKDGTIKSLQNQLSANRKEYKKLQMLRQDLENQLAIASASAQKAHIDAIDFSTLVADLEETNRQLKLDLERSQMGYYFDKPLIEPLRGKNDKLIVKASRAQRLKATIMLPAHLKDLHFDIRDPKGEVLSASPDSGTLAVRVVANEEVSASTESGLFAASYNEVQMTFIPKKKLQAGVYQIVVASEGIPVGTLQVKLR